MWITVGSLIRAPISWLSPVSFPFCCRFSIPTIFSENKLENAKLIWTFFCFDYHLYADDSQLYISRTGFSWELWTYVSSTLSISFLCLKFNISLFKSKISPTFNPDPLPPFLIFVNDIYIYPLTQSRKLRHLLPSLSFNLNIKSVIILSQFYLLNISSIYCSLSSIISALLQATLTIYYNSVLIHCHASNLVLQWSVFFPIARAIFQNKNIALCILPKPLQ